MTRRPPRVMTVILRVGLRFSVSVLGFPRPFVVFRVVLCACLGREGEGGWEVYEACGEDLFLPL